MVTSSNPLVLKVTESGPYSILREGDFAVDEIASVALQEDRANNTDNYLREALSNGQIVASGLESLGCKAGVDLYQMLPVDDLKGLNSATSSNHR